MSFREQFNSLFKRAQYALKRQGPRVISKIGKRQWIETNQWVNVKSTWCRRMRYNKLTETLFIQFHNGYIARYPNSPEDRAIGIYMGAGYGGSKGKFIRHSLKKVDHTDATNWISLND